MDKKVEILLNSKKNIDSVDVDSFQKFDLNTNVGQIVEYDIRNVLSVTELFDIEREETPIYRIYGKIEYLSSLNRLKNDYYLFEDFYYFLFLNRLHNKILSALLEAF